MTTFIKNPYSEVRKKINSKIFNFRLDQRLEQKFKHKKFSERFAMANTAFIGMGFIAQFASLTTAFTMLSYLFVNINIIARVTCSVALVLMIEVIKRESTNDVMKGLFQYKEVERFPALLALIAVSASIYISIEGAKILPNFFIADAVQERAILKTPDAINEDFNNRIADKEAERNQYRKNRLWKGRLASKDSKVINQYNDDIKALQLQKDEALKALNQYNEAAKINVNTNHQQATKKVNQQRTELSKQLVTTAIVFEVLFLLSLCFSWWYDTECKKEKEKIAVTTETPTESAVTTAVPTKTTAVTTEVTTAVNGNSRGFRKIGFGNQEDEQKSILEVEKEKKEYTRICPHCKTPFLHKSHNHTYCKRSCMLAAKALRDEN